MSENPRMVETASLPPHTEAPLPERRSNRPVTAAHIVQHALACFLLGASRALGVDRASAVGGAITRTLGPLLPETRYADENLKAVFPDWDEKRRRQTILGVWENLGRTAAEFAHLDKFNPAEIGGRLEIVGAEKVGALAANGPLIFVSGHFANWEVMADVLDYAGLQFAIVYRAANNPLVDELIIKTRARSMSKLQTPKGGAGSRAIIDMMAKGCSVAMLVDQKQNSGITVPFLGRDAKTATTAARLALRFRAPIVPASVERLRGARFRVIVHDPIIAAPSGDHAADIVKVTTRINDSIGRAILERPEQWLWLHRRWPKAPAPDKS